MKEREPLNFALHRTNVVPPVGRPRTVFWGGDFSIGEMGSFQSALTDRCDRSFEATIRNKVGLRWNKARKRTYQQMDSHTTPPGQPKDYHWATVFPIANPFRQSQNYCSLRFLDLLRLVRLVLLVRRLIEGVSCAKPYLK